MQNLDVCSGPPLLWAELMRMQNGLYSILNLYWSINKNLSTVERDAKILLNIKGMVEETECGVCEKWFILPKGSILTRLRFMSPLK
jgi:hypothetical protein